LGRAKSSEVANYARSRRYMQLTGDSVRGEPVADHELRV